MYSLNARDHFNCSPLHQHHETDVEKGIWPVKTVLSITTGSPLEDPD